MLCPRQYRPLYSFKPAGEHGFSLVRSFPPHLSAKTKGSQTQQEYHILSFRQADNMPAAFSADGLPGTVFDIPTVQNSENMTFFEWFFLFRLNIVAKIRRMMYNIKITTVGG